MIKNIYDILKSVDKLYSYLQNKGIRFKNGVSVFERGMFVDSEPELIVPFYYRNSNIVKNKGKTMLCGYDSDENILRRIEKIFDDLKEYSKFAGFTGFDLTLTKDMDPEWQNEILLLNKLADTVLAVNGIKISANLRTGSAQTVSALSCIPKNVYCSCGFLGCAKQCFYNLSFISKILYVMPEYLMIYGKHDDNAEHYLDNMGISYRNYTDFHRTSKEAA